MHESAQAFYRAGQGFLQRRRISQALGCFNAAQRAGFDPNQCAAARWDCWMLTGQFDRAWQESDLIAASGAPDPHRFWNGQPWQGQRLMLRCLHGLGDTIQFIRYAQLLRADCRALTVQTHPQLKTLLAGVMGVDQVTTWGPGQVEQASEWDLQMEVNELPRAFRATVDTIPSDVPYIHVPPDRVAWAGKLFPPRQGLRIGLCWQSGPWDPARTIPLDHFPALLTRSGHQLFNLQKGVDETAFQPLEMYASDVRDTAALLLHLDLVITVDTMTAHLAGALGRPVWILLPFCADWRWMLNRSDTPWYPTARLFRQLEPGDWKPVIAAVAEALSTYESADVDSAGPLLPTDICSSPSRAGNP